MAAPIVRFPCTEYISPDPKRKYPPLKSGFTFFIKTGRAQPVVFSSTLTEICGQMAKFRNVNIQSCGGAAVHSW